MVAVASAATFVSTQPTCTLEVTAVPSPLARWSDRPLIKDLQFVLSLYQQETTTDTPAYRWQGDAEQLQTLANVVETYLQSQFAATLADVSLPATPDFAATTDSVLPPVLAPTPSTPSISLKPLGRVSHQLTLSSLAAEPDSSLTLTATQLFDLATALADWSEQMAFVPPTTTPQPLWAIHFPLWAKGTIAAMLVAASGATLYALQNLTQLGLVASDTPTSTASPLTTAAAPNAKPEQETGALTAAPTPNSSPSPIPLPPPGAVTPPSGNTSPAQGAISQQGQNNPQPRPGSPTTVSPPRPPNLPPSAYKPAPVPPPPVVAIAPPVPAPTVAPIPAPQAPPPTMDRASEAPPSPTMTSAPPPPNNFGGANPEGTRSPVPPSAPVPPPAVAPPIPTRSLPGLSGMAPDPRRIRASNLPQVTEAQAYFAKRWQPPAQLTQRLEYSLVLNRDGTLQQVVPRDAKAALFLDRTPMPLANSDAFVSPLAPNSPNRLRLVLEQTGQVKVLLDEP